MPLADAPYSIRGKYIVNVGARKGHQTTNNGAATVTTVRDKR